MTKPQGRSSRAYCLQQESALRRLSDFDGFTPRERVVLLNLAHQWAGEPPVCSALDAFGTSAGSAPVKSVRPIMFEVKTKFRTTPMVHPFRRSRPLWV